MLLCSQVTPFLVRCHEACRHGKEGKTVQAQASRTGGMACLPTKTLRLDWELGVDMSDRLGCDFHRKDWLRQTRGWLVRAILAGTGAWESLIVWCLVLSDEESG